MDFVNFFRGFNNYLKGFNMIVKYLLKLYNKIRIFWVTFVMVNFENLCAIKEFNFTFCYPIVNYFVFYIADLKFIVFSYFIILILK